MLDAVAKSAAKLCASYDASILRLDGEILRLVAHHGPLPVPPGFVMPAIRGLVGGRAVLDRQPIHVADLQLQTEEFPEGSAIAREHGFHTLLSVPLLREGVAIGLIALRRIEVQPFTETQIALLQTFADQAVMAVENVRLFNETKQALDRQTATSEILRVISTSPTDLQPVFDAIARHAVALCGGVGGIVVRYDGTVMRLAAYHNVSTKSRELHETEYPRAPDRTVPLGAAIVDRTIVHVPNLPASTRFAGSPAQRSGRGSMIAVPLLRHGEAIGAIGITRDKTQGFSDRDIELLQTFADQAVIAIENVRLFKELQERNRDLTEALEQQTATSEILRVISRSPTDVQPVFDAIAEAAMRLCGAHSSLVTTFDGVLLHLVAQADISPEGRAVVRDVYPRQPSRGSASGRTIVTRAVVHIPDVIADPEYDVQVVPRVRDFRSILAVPMLRDGVPIGTINAHKAQPGPFTDKQVALLETFADQAVIAIENVRLFKELEARNRELTQAHAQVSEALEQQTATAQILRVISSSPTSLQPVLDAIAQTCSLRAHH